MYKFIGLVISIMIVTGCAGRDPHPVPQYQPGDDYVSCQQIKMQINDNNMKIYRLMPKTHKTGKNVALGVTGYFLVVPLFFMDFSDAEKVEIQSYEQRNNWLEALAMKKHCKGVPAAVKFEGQ